MVKGCEGSREKNGMGVGLRETVKEGDGVVVWAISDR